MKKIIALVFLFSLALISCKKDDDVKTTSQFNFEFLHQVEGQDLEQDKMIYTNKAGNNYSVITLKYFISNIRLFNKTTNETITLDEAHYIDISDNTTFSLSLEREIPNGDYDMISFVFGLNEADNIDGRFPNPPQNAMEWPEPLGGGYHYMKLEGKYLKDGTPTNYNTHTGATGGFPYFVEVNLPTSFSLNGNQSTVEIIMDINKWYQDPNTYDFVTYGEMIMGNTNAQGVIQANGANVFSLGTIK
jgi:hypothetical protein